MPTSTKTKTPLFDALGLSISPEISWETMTSAASGAIKLTGEVAREVATAVTGKGLDMNGSLVGFQEGKAKSPELLQQEKEAASERIVYSSLEEARRNARRFAHERVLDEEARLEVSLMSPTEKMKELHLNTSLDEKNIQDAYHIHALREKKKEQIRQAINAQNEKSITQSSAVKVDLNSVMEGGTGSGTINISSTGGAGVG